MQFLTRVVAFVVLSVMLGLGLNLARKAAGGGISWINDSTRAQVIEGGNDPEVQAFLVDLAKAVEMYNQDAFFLDARTPDHYADGHIPGAHNFPAHDILDRAEELLELVPTAAPLVIYCGGGNCEDSFEAYDLLVGFGYEDLHIYKAGWGEWSSRLSPSRLSIR